MGDWPATVARGLVRYRAMRVLAVLGRDTAETVPALLVALADETTLNIRFRPEFVDLRNFRKDDTKALRVDDVAAEILARVDRDRSFEKRAEL